MISIFGILRLEQVASFDEALSAVNRAKESYSQNPSWINQVRWSRAIWQMLKFSKEYDQARQAFLNAPADTWVYRLALRHWTKVCIGQITSDTKFEGFQAILTRARSIPDGNRATRSVLLGWVNACRCQEEAEKVARNTDERSDVGRKAHRRWCDLTIVAAKIASSESEAQKAFDHSPPNTEAQEFARRMLSRFL